MRTKRTSSFAENATDNNKLFNAQPGSVSSEENIPDQDDLMEPEDEASKVDILTDNESDDNLMDADIKFGDEEDDFEEEDNTEDGKNAGK